MAAQQLNNNNIDAAEVYNRDLEYGGLEAILNAGKLEDAEQARRIADVVGENNKRVLASNFSLVFEDSLRSTWFSRGSSFVLNLLNTVQSAVAHKASDLSNVVVHQASDLTTSFSNKAGDLGAQASHALQIKAGQVGQQVENAAHAVSQDITIKANDLGLQAAGKAQDLSASLAQKAGDVGLQAQAAAINAKNTGLGAAQGAVKTSRSFLADKFSEYSQKLGGAVSNLSLYKKFGSLIGHTNMTFALMEEEAERAYRMNNSSEKYAIGNALKVSSMIKEHFGLSQSSPIDLKFSTQLLEESERSRRVAEAQTDKAAVDNARSVSLLINEKFNPQQAVKPALFEAKIEQGAVEAQVQKPFSAAM